ncbi:MAG: DUF6788 family protein [Actinomycetota bacterium]
MEPPLADLEQRRAQLYAELSQTDDFRRGSISTTYRRCGKPNCACADRAHPGHGPRQLLTWKVAGRTRARQLGSARQVEKANREIASYQRFVTLSQQIVEVNEAICDARPLSPLAEEAPGGEQGEKGGSSPRSGPSSTPR